MTNEPLISVIVISYNVEKYISRCLESIRKQNYDNIEIIVVDDGSTDKTQEIIKKNVLNDGRIRFIVEENSGPSFARNEGIDSARGEYVVFVDGDDFVANDYVRYLYNLITSSKCDYAFSVNMFSNNKQKQISNDSINLLTPEQATALLMSTKVIVSNPNKIFKTKFLNENNLRYNESLFYGEGLSFITTAAQVAKAVCIGQRRIYYYRKNNPNSATTSFNINKIKNGEKSILLIRDNLKIKTPFIYSMIRLHLSIYYLGAVVNLINYHQRKKYRYEYEKWLHYVRSSLPSLLVNSNVSLYRKALLIGGCVSPYLVAKLDILRRRRIMKNSFN